MEHRRIPFKQRWSRITLSLLTCASTRMLLHGQQAAAPSQCDSTRGRIPARHNEIGRFVILFICTSLLFAQVSLSPQSRGQIGNTPLKPAEQGNKWGYVDSTGTFLIRPQFDSADPFSDGVAEIELNNRFGFIDTSGRFVAQPKYFSVGPFKEGFAWVMTRRPLTPLGTGEYGVALFGRVTYIDRFGREIRHPFFAEQVSDFSEGLAAVRPGKLWGGCDNEVGYLNTNGEWSIKPQFDEAGEFSEGLAAVNHGAKCHGGGKWGYIDKEGKVAIPFEYNVARQFKNGHACVRGREQWKLIDAKGNANPAQKNECP